MRSSSTSSISAITGATAALWEKGDPVEEYGIVPNVPAPIWGWGSIPDQYGRQTFDLEDEDGELD